MMHVGRDAMNPDLNCQKMKRVKRGECPDCSTQLFKIAVGVLGRMKKPTPINEAGKSLNGRCLICFPINEGEEELAVSAVKNLPAVPRIILTCETKGLVTPIGMMNEDGTIQDNTGVGCFSLGFDDDVSAITLDRKIRTDNEDIDNSSSGYDQLHSQDTYVFQVALGDSCDERTEGSLRARMEKFLQEDEGNVHSTITSSDTENDASEKNHMDMKWEAPPEQAPTRGITTSLIDETDNDGKDKFAIVHVDSQMGGSDLGNPETNRRTKLQGLKGRSELAVEHGHSYPRKAKSQSLLQQQFSQSGLASKKQFLLSTVFVPPTTDEDSHYKDNIRLEKPDDGSNKTEGDKSCELGGHSTNNGSATDIVFASTVLQPTMENVEASEQAVGSVSNAGEITFSPSQESVLGVAVSSQLSVMLTGTNEAEGGTEQVVVIDGKKPSNRSPHSTRKLKPGQAEAAIDELSCHNEVRDTQQTTESNIPTTAYSSHLPSDDGTSPRGSYIPELLDEPVSPKKEEPGFQVGPTSPERKSLRKKPPPVLNLAPAFTLNALTSPKELPPSTPLTAWNMDQKSDLNDLSHKIPTLLCQLQNARTGDRENTLFQLSDCLWTQSPTAKQVFVANNGIKVLAATMWADMMIPSAEIAAAELLLAFVTTSPAGDLASSSSLAVADTLLGIEDMEGLIDALLITMQTLIANEEMQQVGCRVLCCLASPSNGSKNNDGTRSGACLAVLNALDAHYNSNILQEWGLRTLYNQCVYSKHAESNIRTVLSSKLGTSGAIGSDVLERIILSGVNHFRDGGALEWACRLCWYFTANHPSVERIFALRMDAVRKLLYILEQCRSTEDASPQLQEAVLGIIANLVTVNKYTSFLGTSDVIMLILDTMHGNKLFVEVQIEACSVIANVAGLLSPLEKEEIIDAGAVRTIVGAIFAFPREKAALQEHALRALVGLALDSEIAKEEICEHETLSVLMHLCRLDESSTLPQQELLCTLIASLYASEKSTSLALQGDTLGALTSAVAEYRDSEKIQDAACFAYRNLSKNFDNLDTLIRWNAIDFVVSAMFAFRVSRTIQINACCLLWSIGVGTAFGHQKIAETGAMQGIVNAVQTHLEAEEVIEAACGALWGVIRRSPILRQQFFKIDSGVESVTCTLVMHPRSTTLLEMACGVLACASTNSRAASAVLVADGVSNVVETMRNNAKSLLILQHGAHFLRNTIIRNHSRVGEATGAISVLINKLKDFNLPESFLGEACRFIWTIAELSYTAKSMIIALGGRPVLMSVLDHNGGNPFIEDVALGAFKELALEPTLRG